MRPRGVPKGWSHTLPNGLTITFRVGHVDALAHHPSANPSGGITNRDEIPSVHNGGNAR